MEPAGRTDRGLSRGKRWLLAAAALAIAALAVAEVTLWRASPQQAAALIGGPIRLEGPDGRVVTDVEMKGHPFLVFFGYTHCPDVCPTTLAQISRVLSRLPDKPIPVLFISFDPERDTPASLKDYVVYVYSRGQYPPGRPAMKSTVDSHAGESETSHMMIARPDLVHIDRAANESGADRNRLDLPQGVYTAIWWYAKFPDHYAGDGAVASKELGEFDMKAWADGIANAIRAIKSDRMSPRLQEEFFQGIKQPASTRQ